jgi:hypothetical protein
LAIVVGSVILILFGFQSGPGNRVGEYFVSAVLVVGGCLLRIEAAVRDAGAERGSLSDLPRGRDIDQPEP